jgi:riboflavin kinase/FMN adenylyltransferase
MKTFQGIVQKGKRRGHALGYPTANIPLGDGDMPGVYAARVYIEGEAPYMAAVFTDASRKILEAHLLDFSDNLYGRDVRIELLTKIRESADFQSDAELREAITDDIAKVREYFKN